MGVPRTPLLGQGQGPRVRRLLDLGDAHVDRIRQPRGVGRSPASHSQDASASRLQCAGAAGLLDRPRADAEGHLYLDANHRGIQLQSNRLNRRAPQLRGFPSHSRIAGGGGGEAGARAEAPRRGCSGFAGVADYRLDSDSGLRSALRQGPAEGVR